MVFALAIPVVWPLLGMCGCLILITVVMRVAPVSVFVRLSVIVCLSAFVIAIVIPFSIGVCVCVCVYGVCISYCCGVAPLLGEFVCV